jgi:hypothetical protein
MNDIEVELIGGPFREKPFLFTSEGYVNETELVCAPEWHMPAEALQALKDLGADIVFNEVWTRDGREVKRSAHVLKLSSAPLEATGGL